MLPDTFPLLIVAILISIAAVARFAEGAVADMRALVKYLRPAETATRPVPALVK